MKKLIYIILGIVLMAIMLGAWFFTPQTPVRCANAETETIRQYVDERGVTRLPNVHTITMPYAGRVGRIDLQERQMLKEGDVVAAIREIDLTTEVAAARAAVEQLSAAIIENDDVSVETTAHLQSQKFVESMASTVAAAFARMTSGKKRVDVSQLLYNRTLGLFRSEARTQDDLDRADLQLVVSQVDYQQDVLTWQSAKAIEAATQLLPKMVQDYTEKKKLTRAVLEQQKAEAVARLEQALLKQRRGTMASPVDGVVLERLISDEQFLPAGTELLKIGDLNELEVETDLLSQDISQLAVGDPVEIYGPAVNAQLGNGVAGTVKRIHPAGFTKLSSLGVEQQRVRVIVQFAEGEVDPLLNDVQLGVGFRVRVRIFTATSSEAVTVPRSALFRGPKGEWQVFVVRNGYSQLQVVEVGLLNDRKAEILAGVKSGEAVVSSPDNSISDGAAVSVVFR